MTIFWEVIELFASVFEISIIVNILNQTTVCKFSGRIKKTINSSFILILTAYISIVNKFYIFEGWLSILAVVITIIYAFIVLNGSMLFKIIVPIITYSVMLVINVVVTYGLATVFGMPDNFIFTENDGARLIALFLTKLLFFLYAKLIVIILRKEPVDIRSKELIISVSMSCLTFVVAIALVKIQMNTRNEDTLIFICILCILLMDVFII
jgi:hypothetical protein